MWKLYKHNRRDIPETWKMFRRLRETFADGRFIAVPDSAEAVAGPVISIEADSLPSYPVLAEDGTVLSIIAGGLDITDRELLLEEMQRERAFLNAIANNATNTPTTPAIPTTTTEDEPSRCGMVAMPTLVTDQDCCPTRLSDNQAARAVLREAEKLASWWPRVAVTRSRLEVS